MLTLTRHISSHKSLNYCLTVALAVGLVTSCARPQNSSGFQRRISITALQRNGLSWARDTSGAIDLRLGRSEHQVRLPAAPNGRDAFAQAGDAIIMGTARGRDLIIERSVDHGSKWTQSVYKMPYQLGTVSAVSNPRSQTYIVATDVSNSSGGRPSAVGVAAFEGHTPRRVRIPGSVERLGVSANTLYVSGGPDNTRLSVRTTRDSTDPTTDNSGPMSRQTLSARKDRPQMCRRRRHDSVRCNLCRMARRGCLSLRRQPARLWSLSTFQRGAINSKRWPSSVQLAQESTGVPPSLVQCLPTVPESVFPRRAPPN